MTTLFHTHNYIAVDAKVTSVSENGFTQYTEKLLAIKNITVESNNLVWDVETLAIVGGVADEMMFEFMAKEHWDRTSLIEWAKQLAPYDSTVFLGISKEDAMAVLELSKEGLVRYSSNNFTPVRIGLFIEGSGGAFSKHQYLSMHTRMRLSALADPNTSYDIHEWGCRPVISSISRDYQYIPKESLVFAQLYIDNKTGFNPIAFSMDGCKIIARTRVLSYIEQITNSNYAQLRQSMKDWKRDVLSLHLYPDGTHKSFNGSDELFLSNYPLMPNLKVNGGWMHNSLRNLLAIEPTVMSHDNSIFAFDKTNPEKGWVEFKIPLTHRFILTEDKDGLFTAIVPSKLLTYREKKLDGIVRTSLCDRETELKALDQFKQ